MKTLEITVDPIGASKEIDVLRLVGIVDNTTAAQMSHALQKLVTAGRFKLIFDLSNVNYISSAGWGIFIGEIRQIRERKGDLKLACLMPEVEEVYHVLEFHTILRSFPTIDAAVRDFK
jgi:anti-sigma B factor antagonist